MTPWSHSVRIRQASLGTTGQAGGWTHCARHCDHHSCGLWFGLSPIELWDQPKIWVLVVKRLIISEITWVFIQVRGDLRRVNLFQIALEGWRGGPQGEGRIWLKSQVMLELFKLLQGKNTDGFRTRQAERENTETRIAEDFLTLLLSLTVPKCCSKSVSVGRSCANGQIGLAVNTYTSFEAQEGDSLWERLQFMINDNIVHWIQCLSIWSVLTLARHERNYTTTCHESSSVQICPICCYSGAPVIFLRGWEESATGTWLS